MIEVWTHNCWIRGRNSESKYLEVLEAGWVHWLSNNVDSGRLLKWFFFLNFTISIAFHSALQLGMRTSLTILDFVSSIRVVVNLEPIIDYDQKHTIIWLAYIFLESYATRQKTMLLGCRIWKYTDFFFTLYTFSQKSLKILKRHRDTAQYALNPDWLKLPQRKVAVQVSLVETIVGWN